MKTRFWTAGCVALAGLAATASAESDGPDPRTGDRVDRICFQRDINNFRAIKGEDDAVLLERSVNDWYKATLIGACSYRQLKWAEAVAIDSRPSGGCVTPGDVLIFSRSAFGGDFSSQNTTRCAISAIYKWDPKAATEDDEEDEDDSEE